MEGIIGSGLSLQVLDGLRCESEARKTLQRNPEINRGAHPARIGDAAAGLKRLGICGEVTDTAMRFFNYAGEIRYVAEAFMQKICDIATEGREEKERKNTGAKGVNL